MTKLALVVVIVLIAVALLAAGGAFWGRRRVVRRTRVVDRPVERPVVERRIVGGP